MGKVFQYREQKLNHNYLGRETKQVSEYYKNLKIMMKPSPVWKREVGRSIDQHNDASGEVSLYGGILRDEQPGGHFRSVHPGR